MKKCDYWPFPGPWAAGFPCFKFNYIECGDANPGVLHKKPWATCQLNAFVEPWRKDCLRFSLWPKRDHISPFLSCLFPRGFALVGQDLCSVHCETRQIYSTQNCASKLKGKKWQDSAFLETWEFEQMRQISWYGATFQSSVFSPYRRFRRLIPQIYR